jgi:eukaryotic-like serine/threonine-protein kinase
MTLAVGTHLGPYEVLAAIGAGGMGEVYKARDTELKRDVALKILPSELALDPERLARFDREAQALAALNHPHIAHVHGFVHDGDVRAIVMEFVEGATLAERIARGHLPLDEAVPLAIQLADAIEYAHEHGIVHRDLKPANIEVTPDGDVKVLDFGLAKVLAGDGAGSSADALGNSPTITSPARPRQGYGVAGTEMGVILGTAAYMAPEQARGAVVDKRADVWAFGAVLFEMLTGKACFAGDTVTDVLAAVVKSEPDWSALPPGTPLPLRELLRRCLAKDRKQRLHDVGDARIVLADVTTVGERPERPLTGATTARRARRIALIAAPAVLVLAAVAVGFFMLGRADAPRPLPPTFTRLTFREGSISNARFVPGGNSVVYSARWEGRPPEVFESLADGSSTRSLPGLGGFVLFSVANNGDLAIGNRTSSVSMTEYGPLAVWSRSGAAPKPRLDDIRWAEFMAGGALAVVRRVDGEDLLEIPEGNLVARTSGQFWGLRVSRDGRRVALTEHPLLGDGRGTVAVVEGGRKTTITPEYANVTGLAWSPDGREIWFSAVERGVRQRLYAVTATPERHIRIVTDLPGSLVLGDISQSGRVLLNVRHARMGIRGQLAGDAEEREVGWLDYSTAAAASQDGRKLLFTDEGESSSRSYSVFLRDAGDQAPMPLGDGQACALSPDGQWALAMSLAPPPQHLALLPTGTGKARPLPPGPVETFQSAAFLSGGNRIVFVGAERGHADRTWIQDVSGGAPRPLTEEGTSGVVTSPDDRFVAAVTHDFRLMIVPVDAGKPTPVGTLAPGELPFQWSQDGRTLYLSRTVPNLELLTFDIQRRQQRPWKKLEVADPAGITYGSVVMTRDARSYAYSFIRWLDELYVVDGLK